MFTIFDMYMDYWVKTMIFYKFLPGLMVEAQSNLCQPKTQASEEDNQHTE
jgi:hypothetical protein